ncbi:MAG TPA: DUF4382 domain-containing protein [Chitinophagaceae bacterium]|nr:DUF4382 domain-containing protein [Chitinophagaceae bacterium]
MKTVFSVLFVFVTMFFLTSCSEENNSGNARLKIALVDAPGDFDEVNINVVGVEMNWSSSSDQGWETLPMVERKTYDLLKLTGGQEAILVDTDIPAGAKIHQLRLILGDGNTVKVEGIQEALELETPSAQNSGLKLNIQQEVEAGLLYKVVLDFDVSKSIVVTGNNKYILKPVIRTFLETKGGSLKGTVTPAACADATVTLEGPNPSTNTISANTNTEGVYLFKGLDAGTYTVTVVPAPGSAGCLTKTVSTTVVDGVVTDLPISLQ